MTTTSKRSKPSTPSTRPALNSPHPSPQDGAGQAGLRQTAAAPKTGSPVPHLTSLYHFDRAGGVRRPEIARQLRRQADQGPDRVLRRRSRSSTRCGLGHMPGRVHGSSASTAGIRHPRGIRRLRSHRDSRGERFDFMLAHPPYWRMKLYADDPRDLSRTDAGSVSCGGTASSSRNCRTP